MGSPPGSDDTLFTLRYRSRLTTDQFHFHPAIFHFGTPKLTKVYAVRVSLQHYTLVIFFTWRQTHHRVSPNKTNSIIRRVHPCNYGGNQKWGWYFNARAGKLQSWVVNLWDCLSLTTDEALCSSSFCILGMGALTSSQIRKGDGGKGEITRVYFLEHNALIS